MRQRRGRLTVGRGSSDSAENRHVERHQLPQGFYVARYVLEKNRLIHQ